MKKENKIVNFHERIIQKYVEKKRPPVEIREQLDIGYSFNDQVVEIFTIRPSWRGGKEKMISSIAKTKFIKSRKIWRIYWKRASGKWDPYEPHPQTRDLNEFIQIIDEDQYGCFWG